MSPCCHGMGVHVCVVLQTHVAEDGSLVLLVDSSPAMKQDLLRLDLEQARLLTCLSHSWRQQVKCATHRSTALPLMLMTMPVSDAARVAALPEVVCRLCHDCVKDRRST